MKAIVITCLISIGVATQTWAQKQLPESKTLQLTKPTCKPIATLVNINNLSMWIRADGWSGRNLRTGNSGVIFPRGTAGIVFQDGLVWVGWVKDGQIPMLRAGGQNYNIGTVPGRIITKGVADDPEAPDVRIWRIRRDWQTADLTRDAAEFFDVPLDSVTQAQIEAIRQQYEKDWKEWPWQKGAPFYDTNGNGIMDPGEEPGLANADQVVWFVANDLSEGATEGLFGSPPIGLEMQVTLWAYKERTLYQTKILHNTIFKRYRLIYKGTKATPDTAHIDDMYIAQWSDADIGKFSDDLVGCDSLLSLGYAYNGSTFDEDFKKFNLKPPAMGYVILQGPKVPAKATDEAIFDFKKIKGFKNLPMTSFAFLPPGGYDYCWSPYCRTIQNWNILRGFLPESDPEFPEPFRTADTQKPTKFPLSGDPLSRRGDIDGIILPPGDRRLYVSTGPFTMALGDTQEVIIALVAAIGADNRFSVQVLKHYAKWAHMVAKANFQLPPQPEKTPEQPPIPRFFRLYQNYPNPFNPGTLIRYDLASDVPVTLTIYNLLGQKIKTLVHETQKAGSYTVAWDGTDERGNKVPGGVYLYRLQAGHLSGVKKMILLH